MQESGAIQKDGSSTKAYIRLSYNDEDIGFSIFNGRNGTVNLQIVIKARRGKRGNKRRSIGEYRFDNKVINRSRGQLMAYRQLEAGGKDQLSKLSAVVLMKGRGRVAGL